MNSRIGKYSASMCFWFPCRCSYHHLELVPTSRLELLRRFRPSAPQAGVSTYFTTWAYVSCGLSLKKSLRDVLGLGRGRGLLGRFRRGLLRRRFFTRFFSL